MYLLMVRIFKLQAPSHNYQYEWHREAQCCEIPWHKYSCRQCTVGFLRRIAQGWNQIRMFKGTENPLTKEAMGHFLGYTMTWIFIGFASRATQDPHNLLASNPSCALRRLMLAGPLNTPRFCRTVPQNRKKIQRVNRSAWQASWQGLAVTYSELCPSNAWRGVHTLWQYGR